jgi:hypothetical protein
VRDAILVLLVWDLPQEEASAFERALNGADLSGGKQQASAGSRSSTFSAAPADGPSGIDFGKPYVVHGRHASNPFWNLLYLLGLWTAAPSGDFVEKVVVLATNTTDQVKSFEVKATFDFGESAVATRAHTVYELLPGRSRPLTIAVDTDVSVTYDSVAVEIARMIREAPTTPGAEAASKIAFGTPRITRSLGSPEQASVEVTNQGLKRQRVTLWLAMLKGDEVLGVATCYGAIAGGQALTARLWTVLGTVSGHDRTFLDVELDQGNGTPGGIDCEGAGPAGAATGWPTTGDAGDFEPVDSPTTAQVVEAFRQAGLQVGSPRPMTRDELDADSKLGMSHFDLVGAKAPAAREGTRFSVPARDGEKVGGQVLFFDVTEHADMAAQYYSTRSELSERPEDRVRVYARDHLVLLLDQGVSDADALAYERALQAIVAAAGDAPGTGESKGK